ncbi:unnamed protein product, partial [Heterobilharzia americana]
GQSKWLTHLLKLICQSTFGQKFSGCPSLHLQNFPLDGFYEIFVSIPVHISQNNDRHSLLGQTVQELYVLIAIVRAECRRMYTNGFCLVTANTYTKEVRY